MKHLKLFESFQDIQEIDYLLNQVCYELNDLGFYSSLYYDDELGASVEGIYLTFHKTLLKDLFVYYSVSLKPTVMEP